MSARFYDADYDAKIIQWRAECFEKLGFATFSAHELAIRRDVDREQVERLLKAGARHAHVLEIVT
jgi:hypothetical protein